MAFWTGSVTQGGADAFAVSSFATAMAGVTNQAARIREIFIEMPRVNIGDARNAEVAIVRYTKAAMPLVTDPDVIFKVKLNAEMATSGATSYDAVRRFTYSEDDRILIIEDPLYICIDSNATTLTQSAYVRILYDFTRITVDERIALLQNALS